MFLDLSMDFDSVDHGIPLDLVCGMGSSSNGDFPPFGIGSSWCWLE